MEEQTHFWTIELVNERTIKTTSAILDMMGCHVVEGLVFVYFKEKE